MRALSLRLRRRPFFTVLRACFWWWAVCQPYWTMTEAGSSLCCRCVTLIKISKRVVTIAHSAGAQCEPCRAHHFFFSFEWVRCCGRSQCANLINDVAHRASLSNRLYYPLSPFACVTELLRHRAGAQSAPEAQTILYSVEKVVGMVEGS